MKMGFIDKFKKNDSAASSSQDTNLQINPKPWEKGYKILNRYEIIDIKKGGMGIVYLVYDHEWNRRFAIKSFQEQFLLNEDKIQRFMAEAETWTKLERHTNIVYADFVERIEGKPMIFLEYIEGGDLSRFIGKLDIKESLDFAIQFCTGMEYTYQKLGVIHRDIKPGNVMVQKDPRFRSGYCFKITDFGLVKAISAEFNDKAFQVSTILGTIFYMPPEQFPESFKKTFSVYGNVTTRSDIYSFGLTLFQLLTGNLPFNKIPQIFVQQPVHPKIVNPAIPEKLDALIMKCLEKNPDERYSNFTELKDELIKIINGLNPEGYVVIGKKEELSNIDWLNKGVALANLGKIPEAIECIDKSLAMDSSEPRAWSDKGMALAELNQIPDAIKCFDNALELYPEYAIAWCKKGITLHKVGNYKEAIRCFDKALETNPNFAEALNYKGVSLGALRKHKKAILYYDEALKINPRDPKVLINKGASLCALQKYDEAVEYFDRAVEINPRDPQILTTKGMSLSGFGKHADAIVFFDRAIEQDPAWYMAWYGKGVSLAALGKNQEAIRCLEKHIELFPREFIRIGVTATVQQAHMIIRELKKLESQNTSAEPGKIIFTRNPEIRSEIKIKLPEFLNEGILLVSRGQFREALEFWDGVLKFNPKNPLLWNIKGLTYAGLEQFSEVIACCDRAIEIDSEYYAALNNKGTALANLGNFPEALECYKKAIEVNPRCTEASYNRLLVWKNTPATLQLDKLYWSKTGLDIKLNGM